MWNEVGSVGAKPGGRVGHTLTSLGDRVILYGGCENEDLPGDALSLTLSQMKWSRPKMHGPVASPRWKHATCAMKHRDAILVIGGLSETGNEIMDCQLLDVSGSTGPWHWCRVVTYGTAPCPRADHSATPLDGDRMVLFGGRGASETGGNIRFNDIHEASFGCAAAAWDTQCKPCDDVCEAVSVTWTQPNVSGSAPTPRCGHAAAVSQGKLTVMGGEDDSGCFTDCFVLDTESWVWSSVQSAPAPPRCNHLAIWTPALAESKSLREPALLVFGGESRPRNTTVNTQGAAKGQVNLIADCNISSPEFQWNSVLADNPPAPRSGAAWVMDTKSSRSPRLLLFGGRGGTFSNHCLDGLYELELNNFEWKPLPTIDSLDPPEGQICGGELIIVSGRCLDGEHIVMRISDGEGHVEEVRGTPVDGVVEFFTPSWPAAGGASVQVQMSIDDGPWSPSFTWQYLPAPAPPAVEDAQSVEDETHCPGPGLQPEQFPSAEAGFAHDVNEPQLPQQPIESEKEGEDADEDDVQVAERETVLEEEHLDPASDSSAPAMDAPPAPQAVEDCEAKDEAKEEEKNAEEAAAAAAAAAAATEEEEEEEEEEEIPVARGTGSMAAPAPHPGLDSEPADEGEAAARGRGSPGLDGELRERGGAGEQEACVEQGADGAMRGAAGAKGRGTGASTPAAASLPPVDLKFAPIGARNSFRKVEARPGIPFSYQVRRKDKESGADP